jgi:predicted TIM-barrel fold metal-dependent hydrolase
MVIDCDFHHVWRSMDELLPFVPEPYRSEIARYGFRQLASGIRYEEGGQRWDAQPPGGGNGGSDPEYARGHHLDAYNVRFALLTGQTGPTAGIPDPDYAAAVCRAVNDHTIAHWLPVDSRYKMGLQVAAQDPQLAVAEIERLGAHRDVVAVCLSGTANRIPFGQRFYWPIYEAAQKYDLAVHFHPSTTAVIANHASTAAGMATTYLESHTALPQFYQAYLISMIFEGVFVKFPRLRVMFIEGGVSWLVHVLWRMDKEFKALRQQAPYLKRLPSEYVFEHVKLGTQPVEEPLKNGQLLQIYEMIQAEKTLVYASDYPHFDFDEPTVLPRGLSDQARRAILHDNACQWLGLPPLESEPGTVEPREAVEVA